MQAVEMEPTSISYSLSYIHALELDHKYDLIVQEACRLCTLDGFSLGGELTSLKVKAVRDGSGPKGFAAQNDSFQLTFV